MSKPAKTVTSKVDGGKNAPELVPVHELVLSPAAQNAAAIGAWSKHFGDPAIDALLGELVAKTKAVTAGDMSPVESMLYGQAATLQSMFTNLSRRAASQEYLKQFQTYMTLALKAQAQCRATLEALAEIKNPKPTTFVGQANIAQGPQQVNNGSDTRTPAHRRAGKEAPEQNKLMDARDEQRLDSRTKGTTGRANSILETVGASNGAPD